MNEECALAGAFSWCKIQPFAASSSRTRKVRPCSHCPLHDANTKLCNHCLADRNTFSVNDAADIEETINIAFSRELDILAFVGRFRGHIHDF
ncbi:hypothetical protein Trydic_g4173 [Trypoxylus dichotomus]